MESKPKCRGCNKKGEDNLYIWQQARGEGYLWHYSCYYKIAKEVREAYGRTD